MKTLKMVLIKKKNLKKKKFTRKDISYDRLC